MLFQCRHPLPSINHTVKNWAGNASPLSLQWQMGEHFFQLAFNKCCSSADTHCPPSTTLSKIGLGMLPPSVCNGKWGNTSFNWLSINVVPVQTPTALHQPHCQKLG